MRRNRRNNVRKERIIMLASSVLVLTALTMTGIYLQNGEEKNKDDGYTLDFTLTEDSVEKKFEEIARQQDIQKNDDTEKQNLEDDLDYMPLEAGSSKIELPNLKTVVGDEDDSRNKKALAAEETATIKDLYQDEEADTVAADSSAILSEKELHFPEGTELLRPVAGEILIPFSMDKSVYFHTLDQYKYNPALILAATEGDGVTACAEGKVIDIFENSEIGSGVTIDLGDGYQVIYGQLKDIAVNKNQYVNAGQNLGKIAAPTRYFSKEGTNLYFQVTKDGEPVNPAELMP